MIGRSSCGGRAPDTYVRMHLLSSSGQELARSKTSVRRGQPNPLYKETFMFQASDIVVCWWYGRGMTEWSGVLAVWPWYSLLVV